MGKQRAGRWYLWKCDNGTWDVCQDTGDEFSGPVHQNVPESVLCASPDLLAALEDVREFIEGQIDVVDGPEGRQLPNRAMSLAQEIDEVLAKARGA